MQVSSKQRNKQTSFVGTNHFKSSPLVFVVGPPYPIGGVDPIFLRKCEMFNRDDNALFWSVICFHMKTIPTSKRLARSLTYWRRPRFSGTRCFTPHWLQNIGTGRISCTQDIVILLFLYFLSGTNFFMPHWLQNISSGRRSRLLLEILVFFGTTVGKMEEWLSLVTWKSCNWSNC